MTPSQSRVNESDRLAQTRDIQEPPIARILVRPESQKNGYCFLYQLIGEDRLDTNSWHTEALQSKENLWHEWDSNPHTPHTSLMLIPLCHKIPLNFKILTPIILDFKILTPIILDFKILTPIILDLKILTPVILDLKILTPVILDLKILTP